MKRRHLFTSFALIPALAFVFFVSCSNDDGPSTPNEPPVYHPTQLRAFSDDTTVGLAWLPSVSEGAAHFHGYRITVVNPLSDETEYFNAPPGTGAKVSGLVNGTRYRITVHGLSVNGNLSESSSTVIWAPAYRHTTDVAGNPIRVYATTSISFPSGLDIHNDDAKSELLNMDGPDFPTRGDIFVFAANDDQGTNLEIRSPDLAVSFPGRETRFSNVAPTQANSLDDQVATAPPTTSSYTVGSVTAGVDAVNTGVIYYGRIVRGSGNGEHYYFRMLIKRGANGKLVQGSGKDRYVELEFSFQDKNDNPYAKR